MKRSLRKTPVGVSVTYSDGNHSNNLLGSDFTVDASEQRILVSIDLSPSLRVRNKASNCHYDALEFAEEHSKLQSVEIDDARVVSGLIGAYERHRGAPWALELCVGQKGTFGYLVRPRWSVGGSVAFDVKRS